MAIDTTKKIKQVTYNGTEIPLRGYDTSDATVTAGDMAYGVVAYGKDGQVYGTTPTIDSTSEKALGDSTVGFHGGLGKIQLSQRIPRLGMLFREGSTVILRASPSEFGDATAADVAKGKTFTSAAGLNVEGTMEAGGGGGSSPGYKITFPATATNWNRVYGDYSGLLMADGTVKRIADYSTLAGQTFEGVVGIRCRGSNSAWILKMTLSSGTVAQTNVAVTLGAAGFKITASPNTTPTFFGAGPYTVWWPITDVVISAIEMYNTD